MGASGLSAKQRVLVVWLARLALLVYVFQLGAIDHWHARTDAVTGVVGSQVHAAHCHSETANCADSSSLAGSLADVTLLPMLPPARANTVLERPDSPREAFLALPLQPPRSG